MKRITIKPRLVDHNLFKPIQPIPLTKPVPKKILPAPPTGAKGASDLSLMYNLIGVVILAIGIFYLYQRFSEKPLVEESKRHAIIGFNQYVNESLPNVQKKDI
jgi:hypothetical protein